jgi:ABC-type bacteriocin/lantibiotic exporter with double-glycine peptidase domain
MENQTIIIKTQKSPGTAAILAFFFGPLGMLYATLSGAIIMFVITGIIAVFTLGFGLLITNPICAIWAYVKVKNENEATNNGLTNSSTNKMSDAHKTIKETDNLFD